MTEHIVALFGTESAADAAARELENGGIPASAIRRYRSETNERVETVTSSTGHTGGGFWAWLLGEEDGIEAKRGMYPRDHEVYERGVEAGNAILSVTLQDESQIHQAVTILNAHHPLQIDEDTDQVSGFSAAGATGALPSATGVGSAQASVAGRTVSGGEEVIPLAQEQIEVGKRTVDRGVTRVRRYVVETPVERDVTLHGERVTIERRHPVETAGAPGGAFEERTIEVRETEEVPVVEKTARVVEEVVITKEATERTETVRDTVRREEVEVEKDGVTKRNDPVIR